MVTIKVYHADEDAFSRTIMFSPKNNLCSLDDIAMLWVAGRYRHVADVQSENVIPEDICENAYFLTNHRDKPWWENGNVTKVIQGPARSTSVGDVMTCKYGTFVVQPCGFVQLMKSQAPIELKETKPEELVRSLLRKLKGPA